MCEKSKEAVYKLGVHVHCSSIAEHHHTRTNVFHAIIMLCMHYLIGKTKYIKHMHLKEKSKDTRAGKTLLKLLTGSPFHHCE